MDRPPLEMIDTPAAVIDLEVMERNLQRMASLCAEHGVKLRPHTKTHKTPEIARKQLELGAAGITVAKLGEAEVFAEHGFREILVAYELIGPVKMHRLKDLLTRYADLLLLLAVDTLEGARQLSDAGVDLGRALPVVIELDSGLGRTGVGTVEEAVSLARHLKLFPGLELAGIMTHEGHVGRDGLEGMKERALETAEMLRQAAEAIRGLNIPCEIISAGSTPGARFLIGAPGINEFRPGTYVFNDRTQVLVGAAAEEDCALTILATVTSMHPGGRAALDAGTKALTSDAVARLGSYGAIAGDPEAVLYSASEEHGHLDLSRSTRSYRVGDRVHVLPNHVCPAVNLTDRLYGCRNGALEVVWSVAARGRVQ